MTEHLARNTLLTAVFELAASHGVPRDLILGEIGLDEATACLPGAFVKSSQLIDAVELAADATGRADFGLALSGIRDHRMLGSIGLLIDHCKSASEAVAEALPYLHLHNSALLYTLTRDGDDYVYRLQIKTQGTYAPRQYVEALISACARLCRMWLGEGWMPLTVRFMHERIGPLSTYHGVLGGDVRFGDSINAIVATRADFERRIPTPETRAKLLVRQLLDDLDRAHSSDLTPKVATLLRLMIPSGRVTAAAIAARLSMTARTFQRRLAVENTSFTRELTAARLQLVKDYVSRLPLNELAPLLGFSESSAASRFIKTHTQRSPRAHRRASGRLKRTRQAKRVDDDGA